MVIRRTLVVLPILAILAVSITGYWFIATTTSSSLTPKINSSSTYKGGVQEVTYNDEYGHENVREEIWSPYFTWIDSSGNKHAWFLMTNWNRGGLTINKLNADTIQLESYGVELILRPNLNYRKFTVMNISKLPIGLARGLEQGDVVEFTARSPKVFWYNLGRPLSFGGLTDYGGYEALGDFRLARGGETIRGVGSFQHIWGNNLQAAASRFKHTFGFWVITEKFAAQIVQFSQDGVSSWQDGGIHFFNDDSYHPLGRSVGGYDYTMKTDPSCSSIIIESNTSRGRLTINLRDGVPYVGSGCKFQDVMFSVTGSIGDQTFYGFAMGEMAQRN